MLGSMADQGFEAVESLESVSQFQELSPEPLGFGVGCVRGGILWPDQAEQTNQRAIVNVEWPVLDPSPVAFSPGVEDQGI